MSNTQPSITLSSGVAIPQLGFGVWQVTDDQAPDAVGTALRTGYRHIDTAEGYANEHGVGIAVAEAAVERDEVFVTTKLRGPSHGRERAQAAFADSRAALGLDVVDLFLIHWPQPGVDLYVETWQTFIELREQGLVRSIGVSNFLPEHLQRLIDETGVAPDINQVELHPYLAQRELREFHAAHGIATEAWSPLGQGGPLLGDPVIASIAQRLGHTPAQIVIAWHLAIGNVVIPKSVTPARIEENFASLQVTLTDDDVAAISALDRDGRIGPHPNDINDPQD